MSTKVNSETRERLGQSAKRNAAVCGQAGRGATVAGRRLPGAAEQKGGIFCLPGFVEDRGQIFLHVRDPRETARRGVRTQATSVLLMRETVVI